MKTSRLFLLISERATGFAGHRLTLAVACLVVIAWTAAGVAAGLPTEWFLVSNFFGTTATLFILLVMQHSQNRDMTALQVKVDELIRASGAGNHMIGVERLEAEELAELADRQAVV